MHYSDYKTILSPKNGLNFFRGCVHGCIYCDSRSTCYQMKHAFEDIEIKNNAARILEEQLKRKRVRCMISTGAMTDPYMPMKETLAVTRECLAVIEKYGFGLSIHTKSARILEDLDVLIEINKKSHCVVETTLTTYDEDLCKIIEPNVSTTYERFRMLQKLSEAGIETVVWLSPILPFINDTVENIRGLMDYCVKSNVKAIIFFGFGTTMRDGSRDYFYAKLDEHFPGMKKRYIKQFGNSYVCSSPSSKKLLPIFKAECEKHQIQYRDGSVFHLIKQGKPKAEQLTLF